MIRLGRIINSSTSNIAFENLEKTGAKKMTIHIEHSFGFAGGVLSVELTSRAAKVEFSPSGKALEKVTIEDSSGEIADWHSIYAKWNNLNGAALAAAEKKYARQYGEIAVGQWIVSVDEQLKESDEPDDWEFDEDEQKWGEKVVNT